MTSGGLYLWGWNPRRLVCLADLKSAPLDHSGKIPRQIDTHAPARKKTCYCVYNDIHDQSSIPAHFTDAHLDCLSVCLPASRKPSSTPRTKVRTTSITLCLIWLGKRLVSYPSWYPRISSYSMVRSLWTKQQYRNVQQARALFISAASK